MKKPCGTGGVCAVVIAACVLLSGLPTGARGEGSSEGLQPPDDVLLLYSGWQQTANWFNVSSADTVRAARFASEDIAACEDLPLVSIRLVVSNWLTAQ